MIEGKDANWVTGGMLSFPEILADQVHAAAASGKTYADFDEFLEEYLTELRQEVDNSGKAGADFLKVERQGSQDPFASALIENCLEKDWIISRAEP